jgi:hypothetical protein
VGIVLAAIHVGMEKQSAIDSIGDGVGPPALVVLLEELGHLSFEVEAVEEDQVSVVELLSVSRAGDVLVRIDAGAHERLDLYAIPADSLDDVGDDGGGADDPDGRAIELGRTFPARTAEEAQGQGTESDQQYGTNHPHGGPFASLS